MTVRKSYCFSGFALGLTHLKFDVWPWPYKRFLVFPCHEQYKPYGFVTCKGFWHVFTIFVLIRPPRLRKIRRILLSPPPGFLLVRLRRINTLLWLATQGQFREQAKTTWPVATLFLLDLILKCCCYFRRPIPDVPRGWACWRTELRWPQTASESRASVENVSHLDSMQVSKAKMTITQTW